MSIMELKIPHAGEGVVEVRIIRLFKAQGDAVKQDESLYEVETDKASLEVPSPYTGRILEWLAGADTILPVGAPIARIEISTEAGGRAASTKDRPVAVAPAAPVEKTDPPEEEFVVRVLSERQKVLNHHLRRSAEQIVSATVTREVDWSQVRRATARMATRFPNLSFSEVQVLAFCVARISQRHPRLRSRRASIDTLHELTHLNLGIAVELPDDDLATAVVAQVDTLSFAELVGAVRDAVTRVESNEAHASPPAQLLLSYMNDHGLHQATPVLVAPAVAVLFVGATSERGERRVANLTLTIDHQLINGAGAARFLSDLTREIDRIAQGADEDLAGAGAVPAMSPAATSRPTVTSSELEALLRSCLSPLLSLPPNEIPNEEPLGTLGLTSRRALELHLRLEAELGRTLPRTLIWDHPNVRALAGALAGTRAAPAPSETRDEPSGSGWRMEEALDRVEGLSDEQIGSLLSEAPGSRGSAP